MPYFERVPAEARPTYIRFRAYALLRAPGQALMMGMASIIAVKSLDAPAWEVALIAAALPLGNLLAIFWSKWIAQSARKIPYAFWPEVIGSSILVLIALARNSHVFTAIFCLYLLTRAPVVQAHSAIMRANYPVKWRSWLLARILSMAELLIAVSGLAFGFLLDLDADFYRKIFPLAGVCGLLAAFQVSRIRIRGEKPANDNKGAAVDYSLRRALNVLRHDRRFLRYEVAFFLFGFANIMSLPVIPLFLARDLGIDYGEAGFILVTLPMFLDLTILPFWGRKLDRHNPLLMRAIFNFIFSCGMLTYALSASLWVFAGGRAIIAFVQGGSALIWLLGVNYFASREDVPVYMGLHQSLTGVRGVIAPFVGIGLAALFHSCQAVFFAAFLLMNMGTVVMINEVLGERRRGGGRLPSYAEAEREIDTRFSS